ncbi:maleylpyruvate isomerase N-terminal domain-containing protein [Streptomyces sp. SP17BM10]|uniref:maleylpyruvate isomerase N-terminal domain-containing protein n=1 Tax=Streptomyces sp. SP17BM10 TaxID=3002530 RepID=UPI002E7A90FB|nr:maleylpyruvate isomerase N-terminal domain-containing protein [Streptomyces sp. SP17BM10]MEE1783755.1 maleylpyruvate isomerase N-terminal domain-containing protein [Streptomyces sp. SP17BM10]
MIELNAERARRTIVEHTERLAGSAVLAGPDAAVPTAPGWTVTDLVEHVGRTQHWVAEIIERRIRGPETPTRPPRGLPAARAVGCAVAPPLVADAGGGEPAR